MNMPIVDARGLEPPEPFEHAMEALANLQAGANLCRHGLPATHNLHAGASLAQCGCSALRRWSCGACGRNLRLSHDRGRG